ncbi:CUB and sushi domain-containing protein 1-like [Glandiceps talaboti]
MSPNYPGNYPDDLDCEWITYTTEGTRIFVEHLDFNTEACCDFYSAGHGNNPSFGSTTIWEHSGPFLPDDFVSFGGAVWITFNTDYSVSSKGFLVRLYDTGYGSCDGLCEQYNEKFACSCRRDCIFEDDCCGDYFEVCAGNCTETISIPIDGNVNITSPNYPSNYPDDARCQWIISTQQGTSIDVIFGDFYTESCCDHYFAGNGDTPSQNTSVIWAYSGFTAPDDFVSIGDTVWMRFVSDSRINEKGFQIFVYDIGHGSCEGYCGAYNERHGCSCYYDCFRSDDCCVDYFEVCAGNCTWNITLGRGESVDITTPNYPLDYPNNARCQWVVDTEAGTRIYVTHHDFFTEQCCDYYSAGNGYEPDETTSVIWSHSGFIRPEDYLSDDGAVWLRFTSDESSTYKGLHVQLTDIVYGSCVGYCNAYNDNHQCSCKLNCMIEDSCCGDYFQVCAGDCYDIITLPVGGSAHVTSPNYPNNYPNDARCEWIVYGSGYANMLAVIFTDFLTESSDVIFAGHGDHPSMNTSEIWAFGGNSPPMDYVSYAGAVWIRFLADSAFTFRGFNITITEGTSCAGMCGEYNSLLGCSCESSCVFTDDCCEDYYEICAGDCVETVIVPTGGVVNITSPNYPDNYPNDARCQWTAYVEYDGKISVEFKDFVTELDSDFLTVGDGNVPGQNVVINRHSGATLPSDFVSSDGSVWMRFASDYSITARGFYATLQHLDAGSCEGLCGYFNWDFDCSCAGDCILNDNCCSDYFEECAGNCSETIYLSRHSSVDVTSPNYPDNYPDFARCEWITYAVDGSNISVEFNDFVTEPYADYLSAGNGDDPNNNSSVIWLHSGFDLPNDFISDGDVTWIRFFSDYSFNFRGFNITLTNLALTTIEGTTTKPQPTTPITTNCTVDLTIPEGGYLDVASPNYPGDYPNNIYCEWVASTVDGTRIFVEHLDFNTEQCCDYYYSGHGNEPHYNNSVIWEHSGIFLPTNFDSLGGTVWIRLATNGDTTSKGFLTRIHDTGRGSCEGTCNFYNEKYACSCERDCVLKDECCGDYFELCAGNCSESITIPTDSSVIVTSPNFPEYYPDDSRCQWIVNTEQGTKIDVVFGDFYTEPCCDFFSAGNGNNPSQNTSVIWGHTGYTAPDDYLSVGDTVWMRFISDSRVTEKGFQVFLQDIGIGTCVDLCGTYNERHECSCYHTCFLDEDCCPDYFDVCAGNCTESITLAKGGSVSVTTPNYPNNYPDDARCEWIIDATEGSKILVEYIDFRTEECCDVYFAGNGYEPDITSSVIWAHSGFIRPDDYLSNGNAVWMRFVSDSSIGYKGLHAQVTDIDFSVASLG